MWLDGIHLLGTGQARNHTDIVDSWNEDEDFGRCIVLVVSGFLSFFFFLFSYRFLDTVIDNRSNKL